MDPTVKIVLCMIAGVAAILLVVMTTGCTSNPAEMPCPDHFTTCKLPPKR